MSVLSMVFFISLLLHYVSKGNLMQVESTSRPSVCNTPVYQIDS